MLRYDGDLYDFIRKLVEARDLAFLGIVTLRHEREFSRFERWLDEGRHADMAYLARHLAMRRDPRGLLPGARSAILLGLPYFQGDRQRAVRRVGPPRIAQYARLADYHRVMWRRGEEIVAALVEKLGGSIAARVVSDSAPLLERALAARGGSGAFVGKNTCLIHPKWGSWLLLGEIILALDFPLGTQTSEAPVPGATRLDGGCGTCRRCQVHCPTGALDQDYRIDANRCLSYWTIEHRGLIPERFWPWLSDYVFGCDICQLVCPFNRGVPVMSEGSLSALARVGAEPDLFAVATMTQDDYERWFGGTPMTRAKRVGLVRNALIAMKVVNDARLGSAISRLESQGLCEVLAGTIQQIRRFDLTTQTCDQVPQLGAALRVEVGRFGAIDAMPGAPSVEHPRH